MSNFDILIIGAGPGGYVAAEEAATLGNSVAVIEKNAIGGCCLNVGCIPSKTYLQYSHWLSGVEAANKNGMTITVENIDFPAIVQRKNRVVSTLQGGIHSTFKNNGIKFIQGEAKYVRKNTFEVDGKEYYGKKILLATGGRPFVPGIDGLDQVDYLTTDTFFEMEELPDKFVTIGGGVIAVELAFALRKFGVEVTIIEVASDILLTLDHEAREIIKNKLKSIGIQIETSATIQKVTNQKVVLAGHKEFLFDELLVAAGREQNLDLPHAIGLELDNSNRFVSVDEYYETSESNVFAIGDLIGGQTLAHAASAEGIKAARAMSGKKERPVNPHSIPRPLFIEPEVSAFGLSEEEAERAGYDVITEIMPFSFNGRAIASDETEGFVKIISEARYREILGGVIVGSQGADLLHQILTVYESEGTVDELANTVFAHPTLSELIQETAKHIVKK
ncbi:MULTISPECIES: dihydrolipoyl dehydrogenase [Oceanobacillus]|uniref:Dihydrolipoyl dehydrogenase n=1 Tax=Oceanobacillus indicireducens TaxID=1004261 RepID=A0A917XZZ1_9BACI|nr:dihydrolipoyl dehydrogenase [Oceanobacillus indicireducens]GGN61660.1 dihydrolipoyl dehydrogenase [Oceanobacillus indicireducens]